MPKQFILLGHFLFLRSNVWCRYIHCMTFKTILGFDVSSSAIGWAALQIDDAQNITHIKSGYLKPTKDGDIIERIASTRDELQAIIDDIKPDEIAIEEIVKFMSGKSSANTIIMLASFNRMCGLVAYDYLGVSPSYYGVLKIRHGLKTNKVLPAKENMPELVSKHLGIKFAWELNRNDKPRPENYDRADGIAVALYHCFVLTGKTKKKTTKKSKSAK